MNIKIHSININKRINEKFQIPTVEFSLLFS